MLQRVIRARRMDGELYRQAASDPSFSRESLLLLCLVGILAGVGSVADVAAAGAPGGAMLTVVGTLVAVVVGTSALAGLCLVLARVLFGGTGTYTGVFHAMAYAYLPNALDVVQGVPVLGPLCYWSSGIWYLALCVVAVRESTSISSTAAVALVVGPMALGVALGVLATVAGVWP